MKSKKAMRLRRKIMVVVIIISTICCLAAWFGLAVPGLQALYEKNYNLVETSIYQLASQCTEVFDSVENLSYTFLGLETLYETLAESNSREYSSDFTQQIAYLRMLSTHFLARPNIYSIAFFNIKGETLFQAINSITDDNCQQWYEAVQSQQAGKIWSGPYISQNLTDLRTDTLVISLFRPIVSPNTYQIVGSMRITILEEGLDNLLATRRVELSKAAYLCDGTGRILSTADKAAIGDRIQGLPLPNALSSGTIVFEDGDTSYFAHQVGNYDLYVVEALPSNYLEQLGNFLWSYSLFILLAMWLGMLIYATFTSRVLAKPVNILVEQMHRVEQGDLSTQITSITQDEIGLLSVSFNHMVQSIHESREALIQSRLKVHDLRLQTLRLQLNPHFLLNTLDNIRWIALEQQNQSINDYIEAFSAILKESLGQKKVTTVRSEIKLAENYIALERLRFGDTLVLNFSVEEGLLDCLMPSFILQPILENTITHGFPDKSADNAIFIIMERYGDDFVIDITDNGIGTDEYEVRAIIAGKPRDHVSILNNIDARIHLDFGEDYHGGVNFFSEPGMGTRVTITLPADRLAYQALLNTDD